MTATITPTSTRFAATVDNSVLKKALALVKPAVSSRGGCLPVLCGVHLEAREGALWLTTSDLDLTIQTRVAAEVEQDGQFVINHSLLSKQMKAKGATRFEDIGDREVAYQSGLKGRMPVLPCDEFPKRPELFDGPGQLLDLDVLARVLPAASTDDSLPVISAVMFDGDRVVATNRYVLHVGNVPGAGYSKVLVPASAIKQVVKNGKPTVMVLADDGRNVQFVSEGVVFTSRLIEGEFPPHQKLIPQDYPGRVTVAKAKLVEAIDHLQPLITDAITPVRVEIDGKRMTLEVITQEHGTGSVDFDLIDDAEPIRIGFNPVFLKACVTSGGPGDFVDIEYIDPMKPPLVVDTDESWETGRGVLRLIMPVRLP